MTGNSLQVSPSPLGGDYLDAGIQFVDYRYLSAREREERNRPIDTRQICHF